MKFGQNLKLESVLSGEVPSKQQQRSKSPWEPICIFPNFPHDVLCGDSWANSNLVIGTNGGTFLIVHDMPPVSQAHDALLARPCTCPSPNILQSLRAIFSYTVFIPCRCVDSLGNNGGERLIRPPSFHSRLPKEEALKEQGDCIFLEI